MWVLETVPSDQFGRWYFSICSFFGMTVAYRIAFPHLLLTTVKLPFPITFVAERPMSVSQSIANKRVNRFTGDVERVEHAGDDDQRGAGQRPPFLYW